MQLFYRPLEVAGRYGRSMIDIGEWRSGTLEQGIAEGSKQRMELLVGVIHDALEIFVQLNQLRALPFASGYFPQTWIHPNIYRVGSNVTYATQVILACPNAASADEAVRAIERVIRIFRRDNGLFEEGESTRSWDANLGYRYMRQKFVTQAPRDLRNAAFFAVADDLLNKYEEHGNLVEGFDELLFEYQQMKAAALRPRKESGRLYKKYSEFRQYGSRVGWMLFYLAGVVFHKNYENLIVTWVVQCDDMYASLGLHQTLNGTTEGEARVAAIVESVLNLR